MSSLAANIAFNIAIEDHGVTRALRDGTVPIDGVSLNFINIEPIIDAYRRMVRNVEFDICQLTPTTYLIARANGARYKALPIFLSRRFHHAGLICRADAGLKSAKDLEGRRVGARSYTLTTAVWSRGIYADEFGLDCGHVTWVVNDEEHIASLRLPGNAVRVPREKTLVSMLESGEIDAAFVSKKDVRKLPAGEYHDLFPDAPALERDWFGRTGIYPMHALVVVRDEILERQPKAVRTIFDAFQGAHDLWVEHLHSGADLSAKDKTYLDLTPVVGRDPLPYGIAANRSSIEAMHDYAWRQGLLSRQMSVEEMFVEDFG
jgi:4,5-dihydroxyphthalate decarboxylase